MNERDNIIDWVTQVDMAFLKRTEPWNMFDKYEAFADLIRADAMEVATRAANESWTLMCKKMVEFEREACAKICDGKVGAEYATGKVDHNEMGWTQSCAIDIRARGNT